MNKKHIRKIQAYEFDIEYMKGKNNDVDDALSKKLATCALMEIVQN